MRMFRHYARAVSGTPSLNNIVSSGHDSNTKREMGDLTPFACACELTLNGKIEVTPTKDEITITVIDGSVSISGGIGGLLCSTVVIADLPWVSEAVNEADLATLANPDRIVEVNFPDQIYVNLCGSGLSLTSEFNNNGILPLSSASTLSFTNQPIIGGNSCTINGILTLEDVDVDIYHP